YPGAASLVVYRRSYVCGSSTLRTCHSTIFIPVCWILILERAEKNMKNLLTVANLTKAFNETGPVVDDISFEVRENEIFAMLGPSGCGKTTSLRLIAGFERADRGTVGIEDKVLESADIHVAPQDRGVGFVFQD